MAYYDFLNIVFAPLLKLPLLLAVLILSFSVSFIISIVTKYTTNQALMKKLKDDLKEYQKKIKELRSNPAQAMEVQKKAMEANMQYMAHSMKPTLITFIPIILIFGWMSSTFAFESIKPQQEFTITALFDSNANGIVELTAPEGIMIMDGKDKKIENNRADWKLKGQEGQYTLELAYNSEKFQKDVLITSTSKYIEPVKKIGSSIKQIQINYKKLIVLPVGIRDWFGWLGTYIISSIIFTMLMRKIMKVY